MPARSGVSRAKLKGAVRTFWGQGTVAGEVLVLDPGRILGTATLGLLVDELNHRVQQQAALTPWEQLQAAVAASKRVTRGQALEAGVLAASVASPEAMIRPSG
jgi:hypothetical protein